MSDVIRLAVGLPAYGGKVSAEHTLMFLELGYTLALSEERFEFKGWQLIDNCGIEKSRNELLAQAVAGGASWLLMIDADTWVKSIEPEESAGVLILRMISEADRAGAAIVGAPVVRRMSVLDSHRQMAVYKYDEVYTARGGDPTPNAKFQSISIDAIEPKLFEVDAIGTAVFAINIAKAGHLKFKFTDSLSEDLDFCRQVKAEGGKILVDGRVHTAHLSRPFAIPFIANDDDDFEVVEKTVPSLLVGADGRSFGYKP